MRTSLPRNGFVSGWASAAALVVLLTACASGTGTSAEPGGTLTFAAPDPFASFDPHVIPGGGVNNPVMLLYDRLVHFDSSRKLWPELAESWTATPTAVTFKLKQGPTCSDGTPVTPEVVAASIVREGAPSTANSFTKVTFGTSGYSVTTDDSAHTVTITTNQPFGDLLLAMAMPWSSIICPAGLANPGALATQAFGSGPYKLVSNDAGTITMVVRPEYNWGPHGMTTKQARYPQKLIEKTGLGDEATAASEMLTGALDFFMFQGNDRTRFSGNTSFKSDSVPTPGASFIAVKEDGIFADQAIRQAIDLSMDPKALNQGRYSGYGVPSTSIVGTQSDCFDPNTSHSQVAFDPVTAKTLLDQDGWVVGSNGKRSKNGQKLAIHLVTEPEDLGASDYILAQLQSLGFDVNAQVLDKSGWINTVFHTGNFDITLQPNGGSMPTPSQPFNYVSGPNFPDGTNLFHVQDPAVNSAVLTARASTGDQRCASWATAQEALLKNYEAKPFASAPYDWIFKSTVSLQAMPGQYFDPFTISS